ncbi:MAG: DUF4271 domain-containing protein [Bacteroidetes bacterium]|nr:DUF4271 domain-containing protein [Bacteroidota bacterium]
MKNFTLISILLLSHLFLFSQTGGNPFEISPRLESANGMDTLIRDSGSSNPFEIAYPSRPKARKESPKIQPTTERTKAPLPNKDFSSFLFVVILSMLVLLTFLVTLFRSIYVKVYRAFFNDNLLSQLQREQGGGILFPYRLIYGFFFINAGIFIFSLSRFYEVSLFESHWKSLGVCILCIVILFQLKHFTLRILGIVFPLKKEMTLYNFTIIVFSVMISLVLVPANISIAYVSPEMTKYVIFTTFCLLGIIYLFRLLRGLFIANKYIWFYKFHFLLYICTVEIAPVMVLAKLILTKTGN